MLGNNRLLVTSVRDSRYRRHQKLTFHAFSFSVLQQLQDDSGNMIIEGSGVDITDQPEWWDYNYFSYIVPADRVPS